MIITPPFTRIKAFLLGKTASFRLNAYDDAEIAAGIICYIREGQMPEGSAPIQQRAAAFITDTPDDHKLERLAVQAYTLFHLNGFADLMWARWLEQIARLDAPVRRDGYDDHEISAIDLWFWVAPLLKQDVTVIRNYAHEAAGIALTLSYGEIMREVVRVQEHNIASNQRTCDLLKQRARTEHPKVEALCELADRALHPQIFLVSAARTQVAAGNWDRLVVWMLRRHYPKEIIQIA